MPKLDQAAADQIVTLAAKTPLAAPKKEEGWTQGQQYVKDANGQQRLAPAPYYYEPKTQTVISYMGHKWPFNETSVALATQVGNYFAGAIGYNDLNSRLFLGADGKRTSACVKTIENMRMDDIAQKVAGADENTRKIFEESISNHKNEVEAMLAVKENTAKREQESRDRVSRFFGK